MLYSIHVMLCAQMTSTDQDLLSLDYYVRKTFHKTASLMANSSKAVAILGGQPKEVSELAWQYGRHLGLAFQVCPCMHSGLGLFFICVNWHVLVLWCCQHSLAHLDICR